MTSTECWWKFIFGSLKTNDGYRPQSQVVITPGMKRGRGADGLTMALHDAEELDDDLGGRSDQDLALAGLLGVVDALESIVENGSADHLDGVVVL